MLDQALSEPLLRRFLSYVTVGTQSNMENAERGVFPSSENQWDLARALEAELRALGLADVVLDENCYLTARLPATPGREDRPAFGLSSHIDTAADAPGDNVRPQVYANWSGKPIKLFNGFALDPASDAELAECAQPLADGSHDTIITSDGTTLLGADDKAGVAGIVTLAEYLLAHPEIAHGPIELMFSPDEETGHGMDRVPLDRLTAKAFYTVDGGQIGEVESECFNAWKAELTFFGVAAHLGKARGRLVNAVRMAAAFVAALPATESPEATDGYEGYFCPLDIRASVEAATVVVFLRDFDADNMNRRLDRVEEIARGVTAAFPGGKFTIKRTRQYANMRERLDENPRVMEMLERAAANAGIKTTRRPIRGGTDGSRLTELGIPTPNIFTGGHNYHSRTEWASLAQMTAMVRTLVELARLWGE